ncbi:MAG: TetR family transcriptional regulator [Chloroflexi bacterium]|nr:TetR family transcriptional regulator [Chloroflexota bacterium]MCC6892588.1 TetR/AcrR family transcriptional regulator [Anaerolineae bacterium]
MAERTNRRDNLVETAGRLFLQHGYDGTSVRQIAEAVGVTEAALYYHFKDGKRGLLEAVIGSQIPNLIHIVDECETAETLQEFVVQLGERLGALNPARMEKLRWMLTEFPRMTAHEREMFHHKHLAFQQRIASSVGRFVPDPTEARTVAATITCLIFGYGFLFFSLDLQSVSDLKQADIIRLFAQSLAART